MPIAGDTYHQPESESYPSQARLPFLWPCEELKPTAKISRKLGTELLIVLPGNVTSWIYEIESMFSVDKEKPYLVLITGGTHGYLAPKCERPTVKNGIQSKRTLPTKEMVGLNQQPFFLLIRFFTISTPPIQRVSAIRGPLSC